MFSSETNGAEETPSKMVNNSPARCSDSYMSDAASDRITSLSTSTSPTSDWGSQAGEESLDIICKGGSISPASIESRIDDFTNSDQGESFLDEFFTSNNESSVLSCSRSSSSGRRQYVDRVPRLSRRILRHSQQWKLFEESDDELSFYSTSSSQGRGILRDITKTKILNKQPARKRQTPPRTLDSPPLDDSEDELCV